MNLKSIKSYPIEKFVERAKVFYQSKMNEWLKSDLKGKFAAIDPDTCESFIADTGLQAMKNAHSKYPEKVFFIVKIGYPTATALK